jgi:hypothetical protein
MIAAIKVLLNEPHKKSNLLAPKIVIYPSTGKENAQKVLDKLYTLFNYIPGLNEQPRFNAKVTDLIWIAQGDSIYKESVRFDKYFELPFKTYYNPMLTGKFQNYHLIHPGTGKEIV